MKCSTKCYTQQDGARRRDVTYAARPGPPQSAPRCFPRIGDNGPFWVSRLSHSPLCCVAVVATRIAGLRLREQEVAGSNPVAPTDRHESPVSTLVGAGLSSLGVQTVRRLAPEPRRLRGARGRRPAPASPPCVPTNRRAGRGWWRGGRCARRCRPSPNACRAVTTASSTGHRVVSAGRETASP